MISLVDKSKCVLCKACLNICPKGAVEFKVLHSGGYYPVINQSKCVSCGKCKQVCPIESATKENSLKQTFAVRTTDENNLLNSSSGGLFFEFAREVLLRGGVVCGSILTKSFQARHIVTSDIEFVKKMRGSKYTNSDLGDCYRQIKTVLSEGKLVLFSGCPCQVAGLRTFLGKEYENLILIDLICHGVPNEKVWADYLLQLEKHRKAQVESVTFRSKKGGWNPFSIEIRFNDGKSYLNVATKDTYMAGFLKNVYLKDSCYDCKFKSLKSYSDITLADYWGVERFLGKVVDNKGISLCICNTQRGVEFLNSIKNNVYIEGVEFLKATEKNPHLFLSAKKSPLAEKFYYYYNQGEKAKAFSIIEKERSRDLVRRKLKVIKTKIKTLFKKR